MTALFSAIVLLLMMYAAGKTRQRTAKGGKPLFALGLVGTVLVSYHLYVHDLSVFFLAIVLVLETLLSSPPISQTAKNILLLCIALLYCSPLYLILTLRYMQLRSDGNRLAGFLWCAVGPDQLSSRANCRNRITASIGRYMNNTVYLPTSTRLCGM